MLEQSVSRMEKCRPEIVAEMLGGPRPDQWIILACIHLLQEIILQNVMQCTWLSNNVSAQLLHKVMNVHGGKFHSKAVMYSVK